MKGESVKTDECIQILVDHGLTHLEAKIYLSLVRLKKANVRVISKCSNVSRQDIYRVMPKLQKMGLIEKIIARPVLYQSTPLKTGLSFLLEKKEKEILKLHIQESWLLNNYNSYKIVANSDEESTRFKITSELKLVLKLHKQLIESANATIDAIIPFIRPTSDFAKDFTYLCDPNTTKESVKIQLITAKLNKSLLEQVELPRNHRLDVRYSQSLDFGLHIIDKTEITLALSTEKGLPCLWSNNPNEVLLVQNYFDIMWKSSK